MANEGLKSQVSNLRSELNEIEAENNRLRSEIGAAVGAMNQANKTLNDTSNEIQSQLGAADGTLNHAHQQVVSAYELQRDMDVLYGRLKQMELANKRIRECNNKCYYDFAVYRTVRKIVQGIMDNIDFSYVSDDVLAKAIEHKQLEDPDYWLTSVLMALVAWKADQRERAYRALNCALDLDERKTASFLMVFFLRIGREQTALNWFAKLSQGQVTGAEKPMMLLFFSMLSKTVEDNLSDKSRDTVTRYVNDMIDEEITSSAEGVENAEKGIRAAFESMCNNRTFDYGAIRQFVPAHDGLVEALALARNNANVIDFFNATMNVEDAQRNEFLKSYIDQIVAAPCESEAEVYDEIERNEYIIKFQGDTDAAAQAWQEHKEHDESEFDIIAEMMDWIYSPTGRAESNPQMRRNMLVATKRLQQEAGDQYIENYRSKFSANQHVKIDDFEADANLNAPEQTGAKAVAFYEGKASEEKAQIKDTLSIVLMVAGAVGATGLGVFVAPAAAVIGMLAAIGGGAWMLLNRASRKRIDLKYRQIIRSTQERLNSLQHDWQQLEGDFHEQDLLSQKLSDRLAEL